MHRHRPAIVITATLCLTFLVWATAGLTVHAQCAGNIALNPNMEDGFSERGAGEVKAANGWIPYWQDGPGQGDGFNKRPEYQPEDAARFGRRRVHEGNWAQKWMTTFATHHGGMYQQVNVPPGSTVRFSAWAQAWSSSKDDPSYSVDGAYAMSIGIDPTGGTDFNSGNVVWSGKQWSLDQWVQLGVETVAKAGTVTLYLRGDAEWRVKHNDAYFDEICVTFQAPPPPTSRPKPTDAPAPTAEPADTPVPPTETEAEPTQVPENDSGSSILVSAFDDRNGNGMRDENEPQLAGALIEIADMQGKAIASYQTNGSSEPFAFTGLLPGNYTVTEKDPPGYVSSSPNQWTVTLLEGGQLDLVFADRYQPSPTATQTRVPTVTPTATPTPVDVAGKVGDFMYGISGLLLAAVALILPIALRFLRGQ